MGISNFSKSLPDPFRRPASILVVAIAYYFAAKLGLLFSFKPDYIAALWPPNAILLSVLFVARPQNWLWFLLAVIPAELAADLPAGIPLNMALGFVVADWIEVLTAAVLFRIFSRVPPEFTSLKQTATYIACCVLIAPFVAAFFGAAVTGVIPGETAYMTRWVRWFISDALSHLLITPFLVLWLNWKCSGIRSRPLSYYLEVTGVALALVGVCIIAFSGRILVIESLPATIFAPVPILLWVSVRFGPHGIFSSALLMAVICVWYGSRGHGPFSQHVIAQNVLNLQVFLGITSTSLLCLNSLVEDHRESQKRLRENEQKYRDLAETINDWVWEVNRDVEYTYSSPKVKELLGYSPVEVLGKRPFDFMPREEAARLSGIVSRILSLREPFDCLENINIDKSGNQVWLETSGVPFFDDEGNLQGYRGVDRDITQRKIAEQAIADSERRMADIIEFLPHPTFVVDLDGRVIAWNRAIEHVSGIKKEEMIGKGDFAYAVPFYGEKRPLLIDLVLQRSNKWEKEYLDIKEIDGVLCESESFHPLMGDGGCYFAANASRLYDTRGDIVGAIETLRDITALKRSEQEREHLIAELREAVAEIRTLSGLLPICASCKKIRDDNGYWNHIEAYISEHSLAKFTHSICPSCAKNLYPDLDIHAD